MPLKYTEDFARELLAKEGFELLPGYENASKPMKFKCPKGHIRDSQLSWWIRGNRCKDCSGRAKVTEERVREALKSEGYQLLPSEIKNQNSKINYICPLGHQHLIAWRDFKAGQRCGICFGNKQHDKNFIKSQIEKEGYILLNSYKQAHGKLLTICPNKHEYETKWNRWQQGDRCGKCYVAKCGFSNMYEYGCTVKSTIVSRIKKVNSGDRAIISNIVDRVIKLEVINFYKECPIGFQTDHIVPVTWFDLDNENEIKACWSLPNLRYLEAEKNISRSNKLTIGEILKYDERIGGIMDIASFAPDNEFLSYIIQEQGDDYEIHPIKNPKKHKRQESKRKRTHRNHSQLSRPKPHIAEKFGIPIDPIIYDYSELEYLTK
jgi:hypothetical protein